MKEEIINNLKIKSEVELNELLSKIDCALKSLENEVVDFEK